MLYITDKTLEDFIKEDIPYVDLTTLVLGIGSHKGIIRFYARGDAVICGVVEEAGRIFQRLGAELIRSLPSGIKVGSKEIFLEAQGDADRLHMAWKVSLNILEYCSGIASRTRRLVDMAKGVNPKVEVVTTRKSFLGTKELAIKAVVAGGALPHRLGLSETILIFQQHLNFLGGVDGLISKIGEIRAKACEKKVMVEVDCLENAIKLSQAGVDGIQFDKIEPEELGRIVQAVRTINPGIILIGTGGIHEENIEEYVRSGVDVISASSVYFGKPVDIGVTIEPLMHL